MKKLLSTFVFAILFVVGFNSAKADETLRFAELQLKNTDIVLMNELLVYLENTQGIYDVDYSYTTNKLSVNYDKNIITADMLKFQFLNKFATTFDIISMRDYRVIAADETEFNSFKQLINKETEKEADKFLKNVIKNQF